MYLPIFEGEQRQLIIFIRTSFIARRIFRLNSQLRKRRQRSRSITEVIIAFAVSQYTNPVCGGP
jgi:hypothetical protein